MADDKTTETLLRDTYEALPERLQISREMLSRILHVTDGDEMPISTAIVSVMSAVVELDRVVVEATNYRRG